MFYSCTQDFCSGEFLTVPFYGVPYPQAQDENFEGDGPEIADARGRFWGPLTFFGKRAADPTWDFLNSLSSTNGDTQWKDQPGTQYAINATDMGRNHLMVLTLEATKDITFEVEIVRHFEIIPGEESPLEVKSAKLSHNFSSPIDLIRKYPLMNLMANPFAPLQISTAHTLWSLDPIFSA